MSETRRRLGSLASEVNVGGEEALRRRVGPERTHVWRTGRKASRRSCMTVSFKGERTNKMFLFSPWSLLCRMRGSLSCPWGNGNAINPCAKSYMITNPGPKSPYPHVRRTRILSTSLKKPMSTVTCIDGWCLSYG